MSEYKKGDYVVSLVEADGDDRKHFVQLPQRLYRKGRSGQNVVEELALLEGTHVLSKYFAFYPFLLRQGDRVLARAALTIYPKDAEVAYLGFFEIEEDQSASAALFGAMEDFARRRGCTRIVGPMNASFWLGYRMKVDGFDALPYFGEPTNPPYYERLWRAAGYAVTDGYVSNRYSRLSPAQHNPRYTQRLLRFQGAGYTIEAPSKAQWDAVIRDVYRLIMRLYRSFPGFCEVSEEDFIENYSGLRHILDLSLCRMVYLAGRAVACTITVPDYGLMLQGKLTPWVLLRLLAKRWRSGRYVVLYMAVEDDHKGLGTAMAAELMQALGRRRASSIGALIHDGKVTEGYAADLIEGKSRYVLFGKQL